VLRTKTIHWKRRKTFCYLKPFGFDGKTYKACPRGIDSAASHPQKTRGFDKKQTPKRRSAAQYQKTEDKTKKPILKPKAKTPATSGNAAEAINAGGKTPRAKPPRTKKPPKRRTVKPRPPTQSA
jgi:hypothetical protein